MILSDKVFFVVCVNTFAEARINCGESTSLSTVYSVYTVPFGTFDNAGKEKGGLLHCYICTFAFIRSKRMSASHFHSKSDK